MKRVIFSLLIILCSFSLAYAVQTIVVDTVKPGIEATFNETVFIDNFDLTYFATGESIALDNRTADNMTFVFTPKNPLMNGFYAFIVNAKDQIGNDKVFRKNIIVDVNQTQIYFISPIHGISQQKTFDIVVGTTRTSNCRWSFFADRSKDLMGAFDASTGIEHVIKDFTAANNVDGQDETALVPIYVKCTDDFGFNVSKQLYTGYDPTVPLIKRKSASENPVISYDPKSTIEVETSDKTICYVAKINSNSVGNLFFTNQNRQNFKTYSFIPRYNITFEPPDITSNGDYNYEFTCENWAGGRASDSILIKVALTDKLAITVNYPREFIQGGNLYYSIKTNKQAAGCSAILDSSSKTETLNAVDKSLQLFSAQHGTITEGIHSVDFSCWGGKDGKETANYRQSFLVDSTPPSTPTINASSCKADTIDLVFSAIDNQSGIAGYNYSISGPNTTINGTFTTSSTVQKTGLKLGLGLTYNIQAKAINRAGASSAAAGTASLIFNPNRTVACLEKNPPVLSFNVTDFGSSKNVLIKCTDDTGCAESTIKYGLSLTSNCTPTTVGKSAILSKPQYICAEAQDIYGNKGMAMQKIDFKQIGGIEGAPCSSNIDCEDNYCVNKVCKKPTCTDQVKNGYETDVDCGGFACNKCIANSSCLKNSDCDTNYCVSGKCEQTSCTDKIQNGLETDVDCGGKYCGACSVGGSCEIDSDCKSNKCQFSSCVAGEKTWEEWAKENGIDVADKNGDADKDGLTNYEEFLHGTNPNKSDTDGDGYSDYDEINAGTDPLDKLSFPSTNMYRYMLIGIGLLVLILGILFLYYFKADTTTSMNLILIGAAAILFALIDWFLMQMPKPVLLGVAVVCILGTGYIMYAKRDIVLNKISGKPALQGTSQKLPQGVKPVMVDMGRPSIDINEARRERSELEATKVMLSMLKKQKAEQSKKREEMFGSFSGKKSEEKIKISSLEPIKKEKFTKEEAREIKETKLELPKREIKETKEVKGIKKESDVDRLSKLGSKGSISELDRFQSKQNAFEKLSNITRSKTEEIFKNLPSSEKGIESLESIGKTSNKLSETKRKQKTLHKGVKKKK